MGVTMSKNLNLFLAIGLVWLGFTAIFFGVQIGSTVVPPISEDALSSLLLAYFPVLAICVFLLLFLTRNRAEFDWESLYRINRDRAVKEVSFAFVYLIMTQVVLGLFFKVGLHFPGPYVYETDATGERKLQFIQTPEGRILSGLAPGSLGLGGGPGASPGSGNY